MSNPYLTPIAIDIKPLFDTRDHRLLVHPCCNAPPLVCSTLHAPPSVNSFAVPPIWMWSVSALHPHLCRAGVVPR